ncbi:hypothetical protein DXG01_001197 [Tephrocybe rancida]|nr:hypothetical protein DXG01_001197 [Tephrocybe rancida]
MSSLKFSPEQIVALAKKLSSKVSNDLTQYAIDYPKDSPTNKDRSILKERIADLHSVAVKVASVTGFEDVILTHEPFREQMFQLSKYVNDLRADCEQARQDFSFGDSHTHIYRYLKEFKENRKAEAEKAAKMAAEKATIEKEIPAKHTRSKRIPKKSAVYIVESDDGDDSKMVMSLSFYVASFPSQNRERLFSQTGVEFLPKCKYCSEKHNPTECPGQAGLQESIADAYRQFDKLIPHTPVVLMHDTPADAVLFDAQRELIERVKGMCKICEFLASQRAGLRKRSAITEHEDASNAKAAKIDEDTEMGEGIDNAE